MVVPFSVTAYTQVKFSNSHRTFKLSLQVDSVRTIDGIHKPSIENQLIFQI